MTKTTTKTAAKPATKRTAAKAAKLDAPKTEKISNRTSTYAKGELGGAAKPNPIVAAAAAKAKALDAAAKPKPNPDKIVNVVGARSGPEGTIVAESEAFATTAKGNAVSILRTQMTAELRKLVVIGGSLKAVCAYLAEHKPDAKLAHGVTARMAPNAAKAASDQRKPSPLTAKEPVARPAKPAAPAKPAKPAKADPKPNVTREPGKRLSGQAYGGKVEPTMAIEVLAGENPYKVGTKAHATFALFAKAKTVAKFRELVAAKPDAFDAGYIRYAARDGFISLR